MGLAWNRPALLANEGRQVLNKACYEGRYLCRTVEKLVKRYGIFKSLLQPICLELYHPKALRKNRLSK